MLPLTLLVASEVSLAVPICNSLAFAFTAVTAYVLGERGILNACTCSWVMVQLGVDTCDELPDTIVGVIAVLLGVTMCLRANG